MIQIKQIKTDKTRNTNYTSRLISDILRGINFSITKCRSLNIRYIKQLFIQLNPAVPGQRLLRLGDWGYLQLLRLLRFEDSDMIAEPNLNNLSNRIQYPSPQTLVTLRRRTILFYLNIFTYYKISVICVPFIYCS